MPRRIVAPLDGSPFGEQALPLAREIASRAAADLRLVHVHLPLSAWGHEFYVPSGSIEEERVEQDKAYLDGLAGSLRRELQVPVEAHLLRGNIVQAIGAYVTEHGADLVVMATHGRGGLSRAWLGSVADGLVHHVAVPLVLIRPVAQGPPPQWRQPSRILVPLDGSSLAEQVLPPARDLAQLFGAELILLRALQPAPGMVDTGPHVSRYLNDRAERQREAARAYLRDVAARVFQGLPVSTVVRTYAHVAQGVLEQAEVLGVDLIAMATHGRGGVERVMRGSVADKVLRAAVVPVLVYRPQAMTEPSVGRQGEPAAAG